MFKTSRRKIVAAIMTVLVLLWVGTLSVIYAFSYFDMSEQNKEMLAEHAERHILSQQFFNAPPPAAAEPNRGRPGFSESPSFQLSTFYTVAMTYDGEVIEIRNPQQTVHSDSELESLARELISKNKTAGVKNDLAYYTMDKGRYMLVAFKDNTIINESMNVFYIPITLSTD